jgi:hypothetical protein
LPQAVQYHQCYPNQPGFQFWRDRVITLEHFGMRWCIAIYGPVNDKHAAEILDMAVFKAMTFAYCVSTTKCNLSIMLEETFNYLNDELVAGKNRENINIFYGIGVAVTLVDSEGRMAYAQGGDAIVMLCHQQHRRAQHRSDIKVFSDYNALDKMQQRRNFGIYKTWSGFVSPVFRLDPGDVWFISTEANFLYMHDQVPDEVVYELNDNPEAYFDFIKQLYNNSGFQYAGILVSGKYAHEQVNHIIGIDDLRTWNEWKELDNQLSEDLPQGILRHGEKATPTAQRASRSPEPTVDYTNTQGQTIIGKPASKKQKEPSWWQEFSNTEIVSMMVAFSLLLRVLIWLIANFKGD